MKSPSMSLWLFKNVVTWYIAHHTASLNHRVEMEKQLRVAMPSFQCFLGNADLWDSEGPECE